MITSHTKILAVDDDHLNRDILEEFLEDKFDYSSCDSGEACLDFLNLCVSNNEELPFLILLDINMPGIDGLETCRQIKTNSDFDKIDIIFISAATSTEDRIKGYEVGGYDYFGKPFHEDELYQKIKILQADRTEHHEKDKNLSDAMSTAMTAMTNASEIGVILRCIQDLYSLNSNEEIAKNILDACNVYSLKVIITISLDTAFQAIESTKGVTKPIEIELIQMLRLKGAIYHFDNRTLFSYGEISLLVLNMPLDNDDLYGRLKDHLAIIVEGADSRVKSIIAEKKREQQRKQLIQLVEVVEELMSNLEQSQVQQQQAHEALMSNLLSTIEDSFISLGLTEDQENIFTEIVKETEEGSNALFDQGSDLQEKLTSIKMMLRMAIKQ